MSAHNEQNGRHPNFPMQSVAPLDPRIRNFPSSEKKEVCREYVWGKCFKYGQCRFRHECSLDEMKFIIKFCHDHQNRMGCLRPNCTYLHCSSEEQNLFLSSGKLPRVLLERHAAINAAATAMPSGSVGSMENPPPLYVAQPPPPPPPPIGVSAPPPPPPPQTVTPTVIPPPPPPPPTESSIRTVPPAALYTAAPPQAPTDTTFVSQPPPTLPPIFDASRPPPPIPSASRNGNAIKSTMVDACEAGPSKIRMTEEADIICEYCIQRELSLKACNEELDAMNNNKEQKKAALKKAVDEYDKIKAMMRLLLPAEIAVAVEEISEGVHSPPVSLTLPQLMTRILDDRTDYSSAMMDTIQPSSLHELFIGYLLNATSSTERSSSVELRPSEILSSDMIRSTGTSSITGNGFSRLASAQRPTVTVAATVAAVTSSPAPPAPVPAPARPAYVSPPASRAYPGVAASYQPHPPPYQPAVPPPAVPPPSVPPPSVRPAYPPFAPHPMPQGTSPAPYSAIASVSAPLVNAQAAVGLSNAGPAPSVPATTKGYGHYMMGGYNSPPYYSPFQ